MSSGSPDPLVTVLMAVYNGARYIRESIESVLAQSFEDFELLIIDDGSTDLTWSVIRTFSDPRVRAARCPRRGLARSLNDGLARARGKYIARMDADDVAMTDRLEKQVAFLDSHPDHVLVSSWVVFIGDLGFPLQEGTWTIPSSDEELRLRLYKENQFCHGATMIRADALTDAGGYRDRFRTAEDYDLWLRLTEVGALGAVPKPLVSIRRHAESKTAGEGVRVLRFAMMAQQLAFERLRTGRDRLGYVCPPQTSRRLEELRSLSVPEPLNALDWARWFYGEGRKSAATILAVAALREDPTARAAWQVLVEVLLVASGVRRVQGALRHYRGKLRRGRVEP